MFFCFAVYIITFILLRASPGYLHTTFSNSTVTINQNLTDNCTIFEPVDHMNWLDNRVYLYLLLGAVGVGLVFQLIIFHTFVNEPDNGGSDGNAQTVTTEAGIRVDTWHGWFKCPMFYLVAIQWSLSKTITNISITYIPFYLQEYLHLR